VAPHQLVHEGPHPLLDAAGDVHAHNHARLSRRRRPSTWDWANEPVATDPAALRWSPFPARVGPQVEAIDQAGNVGPPATDTWKRKK
jgi:hypothetical protein